MILFVRAIPYLIGILEAVIFWWQRSLPSSYPWVVLVGVLAVPFGSMLLSWKRIRFIDMLEKMAPTFLFLASLAFGLLLVENTAGFWAIVFLAGASSCVSLELLFLHAYKPASYPVNGLSHVNIAYVPLTIWYAVSTSVGLMAFLHSGGFWHVAMCAILGVVLFRTTGHPGATQEQNDIWMMVGAVVGLELGLVGLVLPLTMGVQGVIAALVFSAALRTRRYLYAPKPSRRVAISESLAALALFTVCLATAKWI